MSEKKLYSKYLIPFFTSFIIILFEMVIIKIAPFGSKDIFTYSGGERVASYLYELWDNAHCGRILFYSTRSGVGYDFATIISMYLFNPFIALYLLLPRESIFIFSSVIYILEMSFAGLFVFLFLNNHFSSNYTECRIKNFIFTIASVIYVISVQIFGSGINPINALSVMLLPLVVLELDKIISGKKSILYVIFLTLIIYNSLKLACLVLVLNIIYISVIGLFRFRDILKIILHKFFCDLIVIGLSMPAFLSDLKNPYINQEINLDLVHVFNYTESYRVFYPVFDFVILLVIITIIQNLSVNDFRKLSRVTSLIFVFGSAILLGFVTFSNYKNSHSFSEYKYTEISRIDKAIDGIRESDQDAKIYLYDINGKTTSPVINAVLGYDYVIIADDDVIPDSNLELVGHITGLDIYKVPSLDGEGESIGAITAPVSLINTNLKSAYPYQKMNDLAEQLTGINDIFIYSEDNFHVEHDDDDPTAYDKNKITFSFDMYGDYYTNLADVIHMGKLHKDEKYSVKTHCPNAELRRYLEKRESVYLNGESLSDFLGAIKERNVDVNLNDDRLSVNSITDQDFIILPYDLSASFISADGNSRFDEYRFFDYRVSAIKASDVKSVYSYKPLFLLKGLLFFAIALIVLVITLFFDKKKTRIRCLQSERIINVLSNNRIYIYVVLINLFLYLVALIFTESIPFGNKSFVCSDGMIVSFPQLRGWVESIKNNSLTIPDYSIGTGWNGLSYTRVFMAFINPTKWILFLMNERNSEMVFNIYFLINYLLVSPSLIFYLTNRLSGDRLDKKELKLIPISMAYSLSSFVIVYFSFLEFIEFAYIIPIMIFAMERVIYKRRFNIYIILLALYMSTSTYYAFILCECLLLYFFTLKFSGIKDFWRKSVRFALTSIVAAGMAVFSLIPFYLKSRNCGYNNNDNNALSTIHYFSQNILGSISDVDIMYKSTIITEDWSHANAYCGLLVFLIAPLILIVKKIPIGVRIRRLLLVGFLYLSFGNEFLNFVLHGFHFQTLVPNRFACFYIFVLVVIFYDLVIEYKSMFDSRGVAAFSICSGLLLFVLMYNKNFRAMSCLKSALLVIMYLCIALAGYKYKKHYQCLRVLLGVLMFELLFSGYHALKVFNGNNLVSENAINKMMEYYEDYNPDNNPFIRTDVLNFENLNISAIVKNNSVSMFDSFITGEQTDFVTSYNALVNTNNISYGTGNPLSDIMLNVRYLAAEGRGSQLSIPNYYSVDRDEEYVSLFKNPYVVEPGVILPDNFDLKDYKSDYSAFEYQNNIAKSLIGKPLYNIIDTEIKTDIEDDGTHIVSFKMLEDVKDDVFYGGEDLILYQGDYSNNNSNIFKITVTEEYYKEHFNYLDVATLDLSAYSELSNYFKDHCADKLYYDWDKNEIVSNYDIDEDGKLLIPVPVYDNWVVSIDGVETTYDNSAGGLTVSIPSGKHTVKAKYVPDSNLPYFIISLLCLSGLVAYNILKAKKKSDNIDMNIVHNNKDVE